jgi:hypothetical protein
MLPTLPTRSTELIVVNDPQPSFGLGHVAQVSKGKARGSCGLLRRLAGPASTPRPNPGAPRATAGCPALTLDGPLRGKSKVQDHGPGARVVPPRHRPRRRWNVAEEEVERNVMGPALVISWPSAPFPSPPFPVLVPSPSVPLSIHLVCRCV